MWPPRERFGVKTCNPHTEQIFSEFARLAARGLRAPGDLDIPMALLNVAVGHEPAHAPQQIAWGLLSLLPG